MLSTNPWRRYKPTEKLMKRWDEARYLMYDPPSNSVREILLANPIFRILTEYDGAGLSLHALAAITRRQPREVWEQVKREAMNECGFCSSTHLFVVYSFQPWCGGGPLRFMDLDEGYYDQSEGEYNLDAKRHNLPNFQEMLKLYPLRKCSLRFNPHKERVYQFSAGEQARFRKVYTLEVPRRELNASLL